MVPLSMLSHGGAGGDSSPRGDGLSPQPHPGPLQRDLFLEGHTTHMGPLASDFCKRQRACLLHVEQEGVSQTPWGQVEGPG